MRLSKDTYFLHYNSMPAKNIPLFVKKSKIVPLTASDSPAASASPAASPPDSPETSGPTIEVILEGDVTDTTTETATKPATKTTTKTVAIDEPSIIGTLEDDCRDGVASEATDGSADEYISLSAEEKDDLIDKLETQKYNLKKRYKEAEPDSPTQSMLKAQIKEVTRLLGKVKECDVEDKAKHNLDDKSALEAEFKRKIKRLALRDFNRIIDLTAPKGEREPDICTEQIWRRSKEVVFKGKSYKPLDPEKYQKFKDKLKPKPMPEHLRKGITENMDGNLQGFHVHKNHSEALKYKKYDPLTYQGLTYY